MGKLKAPLFIIILLFMFSCQDNENSTNLNESSNNVIIDETLYKTINTNNYTIKNVELNGDLLTIEITSSGCSGNSWNAILVDAKSILKSNPPQRNLKLSLENNEACLAIFDKEFTFNIKKLKNSYAKVILNLEGWKSQINYN